MSEELSKAKKALEDAERLQETMKKANAIIRSGKNVEQRLVSEAGLTEDQAQKIIKPDFANRIGFPQFQLTNNNSHIKRLQDKVNLLQKKEVAASAGEEKYNFDGGYIDVNYTDNRVQIFYDKIPSPEEREKLKKNGWRWSPRNSAWQRQVTPQAISNAKSLTGATGTAPQAEQTAPIDPHEMIKTRNFSYVTLSFYKTFPAEYKGEKGLRLVYFDTVASNIKEHLKKYLQENLPEIDAETVGINVYTKTYVREATTLVNHYKYLPQNIPASALLSPVYQEVKAYFKNADRREEIKKGLEVEQEHRETLEAVAAGGLTVDQAIKKTAEDHLAEDPEYYTKLEEIENPKKFKVGDHVMLVQDKLAESPTMKSNNHGIVLGYEAWADDRKSWIVDVKILQDSSEEYMVEADLLPYNPAEIEDADGQYYYTAAPNSYFDFGTKVIKDTGYVDSAGRSVREIWIPTKAQKWQIDRLQSGNYMALDGGTFSSFINSKNRVLVKKEDISIPASEQIENPSPAQGGLEGYLESQVDESIYLTGAEIDQIAEDMRSRFPFVGNVGVNKTLSPKTYLHVADVFPKQQTGMYQESISWDGKKVYPSLDYWGKKELEILDEYAAANNLRGFSGDKPSEGSASHSGILLMAKGPISFNYSKVWEYIPTEENPKIVELVEKKKGNTLPVVRDKWYAHRGMGGNYDEVKFVESFEKAGYKWIVFKDGKYYGVMEDRTGKSPGRLMETKEEAISEALKALETHASALESALSKSETNPRYNMEALPFQEAQELKFKNYIADKNFAQIWSLISNSANKTSREVYGKLSGFPVNSKTTTKELQKSLLDIYGYDVDKVEEAAVAAKEDKKKQEQAAWWESMKEKYPFMDLAGVDPKDMGRIITYLDKVWRFDEGVMSMGEYLKKHQSDYIGKEEKLQKYGAKGELATPKMEYRLLHKDGFIRDVPKLIYDRFIPGQVDPEERRKKIESHREVAIKSELENTRAIESYGSYRDELKSKFDLGLKLDWQKTDDKALGNGFTQGDMRNRVFELHQALIAGLPVPAEVREEYKELIEKSPYIPVAEEEHINPNTDEEFDEVIMDQIEPHDEWVGNLIKERAVKAQIAGMLTGPEAEKDAAVERIFNKFLQKTIKKPDFQPIVTPRDKFLDALEEGAGWVRFDGDKRFYRKFTFTPEQVKEDARMIMDMGIKERLTDRTDGGLNAIISVKNKETADGISEEYNNLTQPDSSLQEIGDPSKYTDEQLKKFISMLEIPSAAAMFPNKKEILAVIKAEQEKRARKFIKDHIIIGRMGSPTEQVKHASEAFEANQGLLAVKDLTQKLTDAFEEATVAQYLTALPKDVQTLFGYLKRREDSTATGVEVKFDNKQVRDFFHYAYRALYGPQYGDNVMDYRKMFIEKFGGQALSEISEMLDQYRMKLKNGAFLSLDTNKYTGAITRIVFHFPQIFGGISANAEAYVAAKARSAADRDSFDNQLIDAVDAVLNLPKAIMSEEPEPEPELEPETVEQREPEPEKVIPASKSQDTADHKVMERYPKLTKAQVSTVASEVDEILKKMTWGEGDKYTLEKYEGLGSQTQTGVIDKGLLHQFYTPYIIAKKMMELAFKHGVKTDSPVILEPSMGTGRFFKFAPEGSKLIGFDPDEKNIRIAKILYPGAEIYQQEFETAFLEAPRYNRIAKKSWLPEVDLVIGNPPYGDYMGYYKSFMPSIFKRFEFLFVYLGLKALKKDGILIFIVSQNFMNNGAMYNGMKSKILELGTFVDAFRMPNGIFSTTEVGTDIVIFRKK